MASKRKMEPRIDYQKSILLRADTTLKSWKSGLLKGPLLYSRKRNRDYRKNKRRMLGPSKRKINWRARPPMLN